VSSAVVEEEDSANLDSTRFRDEFVARSRPFVLRNGVKHLWPAFPEAQRGLGTVRRYGMCALVSSWVAPV